MELPLIVVDGDGPSLFGRNWLQVIRLDWSQLKLNRVETATPTLEKLLEVHGELFESGVRTLKGYTAHLEINKDATPRFFKPKSVPYALRGAIEKELDRLEANGVLERVHTSRFATPIVPVPKCDGSIRICGDYKVTVNPELSVDQYPLPKPDDIFATLAGGEKFLKVDLANAYQQVLLDEESRDLVTINTHRGLYQFTRLPFGIASAPAVFQNLMDQILQGTEGTGCYLDDIIFTGKNDEDHLKNLSVVLSRLQKYGLRLKRSKCVFLQPEVEFLGCRIDKTGLHTSDEKVTAIKQAPTPKNVTQLRSFLGLLNYYGCFLANLSTLCQPLNHLFEERHSLEVNQPLPTGFPASERAASISKGIGALQF